MKLSDLTNGVLDYWVSRAERERAGVSDGSPLVVQPYSKDPQLAQVIIEREHIRISVTFDEDDMECPAAQVPPDGEICQGETEAEAAMLCYVYKVYGCQLFHADTGD